MSILKLTYTEKDNLDIKVLNKALEIALEISLNKLLMSITDTRYHQGVAQVLTELVNLTKV